MVPDGLLCGLRLAGLLGAVRLRPRPGVRYAKQRANASAREVAARARDGTPDGIEGQAHLHGRSPGLRSPSTPNRELARWAGAGLADLASLFGPSPRSIVGGGTLPTRATWSWNTPIKQVLSSSIASWWAAG
ncbi:hypothetical protein GCM10017687_21020 [Streptomyces echinatus]